MQDSILFGWPGQSTANKRQTTSAAIFLGVGVLLSMFDDPEDITESSSPCDIACGRGERGTEGPEGKEQDEGLH